MLEDDIDLAKAGGKQSACTFLRQVVAEEPDNEPAPEWLAYCAETVSERREALQRVLDINPDNHGARRAVEESSEKRHIKEKIISPEFNQSNTNQEQPRHRQRNSWPCVFFSRQRCPAQQQSKQAQGIKQ